MGYSICIMKDDLKCKRDINEDLDRMHKGEELFLPWYWSEGRVKTDDRCFKWTDYFVNDLIFMKNMGVRGYLITKGEEDDYYKYVVNGEMVKEYYGRIVFPRNQFQVMKMGVKMKKKKL